MSVKRTSYLEYTRTQSQSNIRCLPLLREVTHSIKEVTPYSSGFAHLPGFLQSNFGWSPSQQPPAGSMILQRKVLLSHRCFLLGNYLLTLQLSVGKRRRRVASQTPAPATLRLPGPPHRPPPD